MSYLEKLDQLLDTKNLWTSLATEWVSWVEVPHMMLQKEASSQKMRHVYFMIRQYDFPMAMTTEGGGVKLL